MAVLRPSPLALAFALGLACRPASEPPSAAVVPVSARALPAAASLLAPSATKTGSDLEVAPRALRRCFPGEPVWFDAPVAELLDRAAAAFEREEFADALACAEEAARQLPRSVEAHHDRAMALVHLDRLDEARDAMSLAVALDPNDPETLEAAADLYVNRLLPSAERSAVGLEYARRGGGLTARRDRKRLGRLALLEGQALTDLGRAGDALRRIDHALTLIPDDIAARYERGVALFELCRFAEARRALEKVLSADADHTQALYHLALIDERDGNESEAARRFAVVAGRDPRSFPTPPLVPSALFAERVRRAIEALPPDVAADIRGIPVNVAELPDLEDLTAEAPPLSPTILGLFRGRPLGGAEDAPEGQGQSAQGRSTAAARTGGASAGTRRTTAECGPGRAIVLYRRNLLRTLRDASELDAAIARTLLHEVGHLRGEDDGSLRDRGLE